MKQQQADERIAMLKVDLRNRLQMSGKWIENTFTWLQKKAKVKSEDKKKSLQRKFDILKSEKLKEKQNVYWERTKLQQKIYANR